MKRIVSIGTATQDVFLSGEVFTPKCSEGVCYEHLELGAKLTVDEAAFATGGNACNASVTFARQGLNSWFVGMVGEDPAGNEVISELKREGVDLGYLGQQPQYRTSYSTILLAPGGERTILRVKGDTYKYFEKFPFSKLEADYAYISSLGTLENLSRAMTSLSGSDVKIAFNPGSREVDNYDLTPYLEYVSILIMNKDEALKMFDTKSLSEALAKSLEKVDHVVITDGANGSLASDGKVLVRAGMYKDVPVIDRTGAGDAFGSGFVAGLVKGLTLQEAVVMASANSTSVVSHIGAKKGILSESDDIDAMELEITNIENKQQG